MNMNMNSEKQQQQKQSKPFCSLAYLAKSTIAINGNNGIRIVNANSNNNNNNTNNSNNNINNNHQKNSTQNTTPHVAETARVKACASPELPTGASTTITSNITTATSAAAASAAATSTKTIRNNGVGLTGGGGGGGGGGEIKDDYFGAINEEQPPPTLTSQQQAIKYKKQNVANANNVDQQYQQQYVANDDIVAAIRPWEIRSTCLTTKSSTIGNYNDKNIETKGNCHHKHHHLYYNNDVDNEDNGDGDGDDDGDGDIIEDDDAGDDDDDDDEDIVDAALRQHYSTNNNNYKNYNSPQQQQQQHYHHAMQHHHQQNQQQQHNGGLHSCLTSLQSRLNSLDCWDYTIELECLKGPQDLQLAAELGKTLLERNKELEILLKEHKTNNEEQEREIVHLRKQINAMTEVNDTRLKVYEQLEVGIQDLERTNHRLNVEKTRDKKQIKTLTHSIETLESRCEDLTKQFDETRQTLSSERRKNERLLQERNNATRKQAAMDEFANVGGMRGIRPTNGNEQDDEMGYNANNTSGLENCSFGFDQRNQANSTGLSDSLSGTGSGSVNVSANASANGSGLDIITVEDPEELVKLVNDLESTKRAFIFEQQRCSELEEQLVSIIQENQTLQTRIEQTSANEEMMTMHDEFSILDEVRQGQMCSRCLRAVEDRATLNDEASSIAPTEDAEEEDERSLLGLEMNNDNASEISSQAGYRPSGSTNGTGLSIKMNPTAADSLDLITPGSPNPYRDLVEKYEALLEVQRTSIARKTVTSLSSGVGLSLAEEFQRSGDFNQTQKLMFQAAAAVAHAQAGIGIIEGAADANGMKNTTFTVGNTLNGINLADGASSCNDSITNEAASSSLNGKLGKSARGRTPTEYSEAETSSSGFSDETSNKFTQTDERPGYFLCSIGDDNCKFTIYDDVSPIDSRFRNRPEYRELFKEIFAVLKKAAENKEEGDKLPLLDDDTNAGNVAAANATAATCSKVPPVTPANEELPVDFGDDTQSIISSAVSEQSFAMSECITKMERKTAKKHIIECRNQENKPPMCASMSTSIAQLATAPATATGSSPNASAAGGKQIIENGRVLTPFKREPLEYLTIGVGIKKKGRRKNRPNNSGERVESPLALPSPPRFYMANNSGSGRRCRKDLVPMLDVCSTTNPTHPILRHSRNCAVAAAAASPKYDWNGSPMVIYNRNLSVTRTVRRREIEVNGVEYRPNTVSQEFHKLKKLDLSYAEVLRRADACDHHHQQQMHVNRKQQQQHRRCVNNVNKTNNSLYTL